MGTKSSTEFGQIYITLDHPSYFQGEYATGTISLNLLKDFPANELFLKMKGKEDAHWTEGAGQSTSQYFAKKIIISHQFLLYKSDSSIILSSRTIQFPIFSLHFSHPPSLLQR